MDTLQQLIEKAQQGSLTDEERELFFKEFDKQMLEIKEKNPKKYLDFLKEINVALQSFKDAVKDSTS
ncbi:hypothetical protein L0Y41_01420 [bacterium]|nr:hypothetical protein [bacterium]